MKDIKALANQVLKMQEELNLISPADARYSGILALMTEKMAEVDAERTHIEDLNAAKFLLNKHGYAFKIWGPDDIERRIDMMMQAEAFDRVEVAKVVSHVMEGDDWASQSEETYVDDANLYALIEGTRGDHPEWFIKSPENED